MLRILVLCGIASLVLCGCGASPNCNLQNVVSVGPLSATADHMAKAPGDQQQFKEFSAPAAMAGCAVPTHIALLQPSWTVSDPVNVSISSAKDETNGLATCLGATRGAVRIAAVGGPATAAAILTCR